MNYKVGFLVLLLHVTTVWCAKEKKIVVVMSTYNAKEYVGVALQSIFDQRYKNYTLLVVDDCSVDGTQKYVEDYAQECSKTKKLALYRNKQRRIIPLANYARAIKVCDDTDIVVVLEPQDFFADEHVLSRINELYQNNGVWMTYGPTRLLPSDTLVDERTMPQEVVDYRAYRNWLHAPTKFHSFYAGLFKRIDVQSLMDRKRNFLALNNDIVAVMQMLEFARKHVRYMPEPLVHRREDLDDTRYQIAQEEHDHMEIMVRGWPQQDALKSLF